MSVSHAEYDAMRRALVLAATPGVPLGPNPRVGCVLLDDDGAIVAEGYHRGAGTAHAEADALDRAGERARGTTAVVTLEPCNHTGRTGPCARRLVDAGVRRVVFAQADPNPVAAGGAATLRAAGIDVDAGLLAAESRVLNRVWTFATEHQRPFVTWKFATTLDGRSAAADGTSRWISSAASRRDTHRLRALCDTILVGTNTVEVDDPLLTVRAQTSSDRAASDRAASDRPAPDGFVPGQAAPGDPAPGGAGRPLGVRPLRAVMGMRDLPASSRVFNGDAQTVRLRTRDPHTALAELWRLDRQHVFLEGGPTLAASFLSSGLVDEIVVYVAPLLLGAGRPAVADLGIATLADALRLHVSDIAVLDGVEPGEERNVRLTLTPRIELAQTGPAIADVGSPAPKENH